VLFELRRADAEALMGLCPVFTRAIATMLAGRMRHLAYAVGEQSLKHVGGRLAQLLLDLADREGEARSGETLLPRLSQEELASMVAACVSAWRACSRKCAARGACAWKAGALSW